MSGGPGALATDSTLTARAGKQASSARKRAVSSLASLKNLLFHDLRYAWKANARRPFMREEIERSIMGHSHRSVLDRYGHISDEELVSAIDRMTFDHEGPC
jgi:hypothetical protein